MEKKYELCGYLLPVSFSKGLIRITDIKTLKKYLSTDIQNRSDTLVNRIKLDYLKIFKQELKINHNSLVVEIWGHVSASKIISGLRNKVTFAPIQQLSKQISKRSDIIDCGEKGIDSNRFLWDILAPVKRIWLILL